MTEHTDIRQIISAYFDGEATAEEKGLINEHLKSCPSCQKYYQDLSKLSSSLQSWDNEDLSPDLEQKINKNLFDAESREGKKMKPQKPLSKLAAGGTIIVGILAIVASLQVYSMRTIQGRIRDASSYLSTQTAYEPYYLDTNYSVSRDKGIGSLAYKFDKDEGRVKKHYFFGKGTPEAMFFTKDKQFQKEYSAKGMLFPEDEESQVEIPDQQAWNTEQYDRIYENDFLAVTENPLSTFSIDVDTASYSNIRRFLNNGQRPPRDAVRIEEMINYFVYDYPQPLGNVPFSITTEAAVCPWNPQHTLAMIGLQGKELVGEETPPSNLVFLIDVSGSMNQPNKLPLLKSAFRLMVQQLRSEEQIAIVTYAGSAGLVLNSTPGHQKGKILQAIERLQPGGSTAGAQGVKLAYQIASQNFIPNGNNRVILATDGDFNVGVSSDGELTRIIEDKRKEGVFLTVLGFGTGNYKDSKMEKLADKGNGNYYYIDNLNEGKKVLVKELGSTLFAIAKDVKLQIEFNPAQVEGYRLIGYENRILAKEDFNDDTKDAGELGAGHSVTAFYELIPADSYEEFPAVDPLVYQRNIIQRSPDLMTVKLRYKRPQESKSNLITQRMRYKDIQKHAVSDNFRFASAVAEFGLLLRDSKYKGTASYHQILERARQAQGADHWLYRAEFINLVEKAGRFD